MERQVEVNGFKSVIAFFLFPGFFLIYFEVWLVYFCCLPNFHVLIQSVWSCYIIITNISDFIFIIDTFLPMIFQTYDMKLQKLFFEFPNKSSDWKWWLCLFHIIFQLCIKLLKSIIKSFWYIFIWIYCNHQTQKPTISRTCNNFK